MIGRLSKQQRASLLHAVECDKQGIKMHKRFLCSIDIKGGDGSRPYFEYEEAERSLSRLVDRKLLRLTSHGMYEITELGKQAAINA